MVCETVPNRTWGTSPTSQKWGHATRDCKSERLNSWHHLTAYYSGVHCLWMLQVYGFINILILSYMGSLAYCSICLLYISAELSRNVSVDQCIWNS